MEPLLRASMNGNGFGNGFGPPSPAFGGNPAVAAALVAAAAHAAAQAAAAAAAIADAVEVQREVRRSSLDAGGAPTPTRGRRMSADYLEQLEGEIASKALAQQQQQQQQGGGLDDPLTPGGRSGGGGWTPAGQQAALDGLTRPMIVF
jgi:opacity protein-like surface antigen